MGNLPYSVTEDSLKELFDSYGEIESVKVISDNFTGRSKGFGFVVMSNNSEADKAISELDGNELDGRKIKVNIAKPKTERKPSYSNRNSY